jgi:hypothetical protein
MRLALLLSGAVLLAVAAVALGAGGDDVARGPAPAREGGNARWFAVRRVAGGL